MGIAGHVVGTRGSGIVSSAVDMLSMVCGMSGVGRVCEMCLARGGVGVRGLGLDFINHVGTWRWVLDVCLGCGGVCGEWVEGLDQGLEG